MHDFQLMFIFNHEIRLSFLRDLKMAESMFLQRNLSLVALQDPWLPCFWMN